MRLIRSLFSAFVLFATACAAHGAPVLGEDYGSLTTAQPTEAGKKVEVIEFFAYYCPHCNALDQSLSTWVKAQGDNVVFKRIHTTITGEPVPQQRLFYTLETMGKLEQLHTKILYAIHIQRKHLDTDEQILDFIAQQGIDKQNFLDVYNSFSVQSKVNRAVKMQAAYDVHTWPTIVLDGRWVLSPPISGAKLDSYDENVAQNLMLKTMDDLVSQLHEARNKQ
jgi:thiol:disulfide interchange protein DsbA